MTEVNNLQGIILGLVVAFMILGIGVLVLDKFESGVKTSTAVGHELVAISSGAATAAHGNMTSFHTFWNGSNSSAVNLKWKLGQYVNYTLLSGRVVVDTAVIKDGTYNVSYTYMASNIPSRTLVPLRNEVGGIGTTWSSLIIVVLMLSVILTLVLRSFGRQ